MARIRTIKPEFFRHEKLQDLEIEFPELRAMMVFAALWGHCDKNGIFEWKPRQLQLDILPFVWEATGKHLGSTLEALVKHGFIKTYTDGQKTYGFVPTFKEHQRVNGKEAQAPALYPKVEEMQEVEVSEALVKHRGSTREAIETTGREGNRKGIGREEEVKSQAQKIEKSPPREAALITVPDFVDPASWFGFIEMRKKIKKPATTRAMEMLIKKLVMFHNAGHDANAILDQSTVNGWQDLYELKDDNKGRHQQGQTFEQQKMNNTKRAMIDFVGGGNDGSGQKSLCLTDG